MGKHLETTESGTGHTKRGAQQSRAKREILIYKWLHQNKTSAQYSLGRETQSYQEDADTEA